MFSCCTVPDSKENELGSSTQQNFVSAHKNSRVVLVPYFAWKHVPTATSGPFVLFIFTDEFSVRVTKLLQGLVSHELTAYLSVSDVFLTH